jgi:hypothetical protein
MSNISYLLQYGKISKIKKENELLINADELVKYYKTINQHKEHNWKNKLGYDLNWALSFSQFKEAETTKHVHRLHPYKGKFIPQLVEYFLDSHIDDFKKERFFKTGDIILDPFCGSGTTLVESNELGLHAVGVDVSAFNALISNAKIYSYDISDIKKETDRISKALRKFLEDKKNIEFENKLLEELKRFNDKYFPSPDFRRMATQKEIDEKKYGLQKEAEFMPVYEKLIKQFNIDIKIGQDNFLDKWFLKAVKDEIYFVFEQIKTVQNKYTKIILSIILSRTIRSCRATTHSDLATLINPVTSTYYCKKHGKICKPLFSISGWWDRYTKDTLKRILEFDKLRTDTYQKCLVGDSRNIDIFAELELKHIKFANLIKEKKIAGVFSSPPYVGLINYHEQHAYSYDLFGFKRNDNLEIGSLIKGQGREARESYVQGITAVLNNCKRFLIEDCNIFLVANDKYNLYNEIAEKSGMTIVNRFKRPVLNRTEKDKAPYSEIIFHLKRK